MKAHKIENDFPYFKISLNKTIWRSIGTNVLLLHREEFAFQPVWKDNRWLPDLKIFLYHLLMHKQ
jgi:hypothetical protein